jgi:protein gp37
MGKNSKIEWTHHTFNPWWGCVKISHACTFCYADTWARRVGMDLWGPKAPRRFFSDTHWRQPVMWDKEAKISRQRLRVFCASMADVFEDRRDLDGARTRLWKLIEDTPNLDWLLLTKRPENIKDLGVSGVWPHNVWLGTTVEDQKTAEERVPHLVAQDARFRFISAEPLLGPVDLTKWLGESLHWVIAGGESGGKARIVSPTWIRSLREQCRNGKAGFHFKQWGEWAPEDTAVDSNARCSPAADGIMMVRIGKRHAGRELDGRTWDELPKPKRRMGTKPLPSSPPRNSPVVAPRRRSASVLSKLPSGRTAKRA